jgi:hypothetical protein
MFTEKEEEEDRKKKQEEKDLWIVGRIVLNDPINLRDIEPSRCNVCT